MGDGLQSADDRCPQELLYKLRLVVLALLRRVPSPPHRCTPRNDAPATSAEPATRAQRNPTISHP